MIVLPASSLPTDDSVASKFTPYRWQCCQQVHSLHPWCYDPHSSHTCAIKRVTGHCIMTGNKKNGCQYLLRPKYHVTHYITQDYLIPWWLKEGDFISSTAYWNSSTMLHELSRALNMLVTVTVTVTVRFWMVHLVTLSSHYQTHLAHVQGHHLIWQLPVYRQSKGDRCFINQCKYMPTLIRNSWQHWHKESGYRWARNGDTKITWV